MIRNCDFISIKTCWRNLDDTVCGGAAVQPREGAAAPHEGSCGESGGVQRWETPTAAEADARWSRPGCLSGGLLATLTATAGVIAISVEAAAPSMSIPSFAVASLFSRTWHWSCWSSTLLWEDKSEWWRKWKLFNGWHKNCVSVDSQTSGLIPSQLELFDSRNPITAGKNLLILTKAESS